MWPFTGSYRIDGKYFFSGGYKNVKNNLRTLWHVLTYSLPKFYFKPILNHSGGYDHTQIYALLGASFREMHDHLSNCYGFVGSEKTLREYKIMIEVCRRLTEEDYYQGDDWDRVIWVKGKKKQYINDVRHQQDLDYLHQQMRRKSRTWWC